MLEIPTASCAKNPSNRYLMSTGQAGLLHVLCRTTSCLPDSRLMPSRDRQRDLPDEVTTNY